MGLRVEGRGLIVGGWGFEIFEGWGADGSVSAIPVGGASFPRPKFLQVYCSAERAAKKNDVPGTEAGI